MNFKERGITIGDLLLLIIFVIVIFFVTGKLKDQKQQTSFINTIQLNTFNHFHV